MRTTINYVVFNSEGKRLGVVKSAADVRNILSMTHVPCKNPFGRFEFDLESPDSLQEVNFKEIENQHNVVFLAQIDSVYYDVYDKNSKYLGRISTRKDLLGILSADQIIAKYSSFELDADSNDSLQEVNITAIEDAQEMTFVLLAPVGSYGYRR